MRFSLHLPGTVRTKRPQSATNEVGSARSSLEGSSC
jgi:hypothetical protein